MTTAIEWTDETWNPITGCSKISEGCRNCYAEGVDKRFAATWGHEHKPWTAMNAAHNVRLHHDRINQPFSWKKPRRIFVNSMSDLFHEQVPENFIAMLIRMVIEKTPQHTYQVLTKRPARMVEVLKGLGDLPKNLWLGVSAENQQAADERIPLLLKTPAAVKFLSCEPLLRPLDFDTLPCPHGCQAPDYCGVCEAESPGRIDFNLEGIDWVIVGGESGPGARPMHPQWVRDIRDQCQMAKVPFFFKQWGEWFPRDQWEHNPELVLPDDDVAYMNSPNTHVFEDLGGLYPVHRVGKKKAGRLLDGRTWDEMPR